MDPFNLTLAALGLLVICLGLGSRWLEERPIPMPLLSLLFGVLLGPEVLGWLDLSELGSQDLILEHSTRLVLAVSLFSVALGVPKLYPRRHWRTILPLLILGMPLMWIVSSAVAYVALGCGLWLALLIGAIVTATDPIACSPMVVGPMAERILPRGLRDLISFESGANDGLGYLFVFLPLLMLTRPEGEVWHEWLVETFLLEVLTASVAGAILGYVAGRLLIAAEKRDLIFSDWRLIYTVAVSLLAAGVGRLVGSDELLVVFAAGVAFVQVADEANRAEEEQGQEAVNRFFSFPVFALIGLALPWAGWAELGWAGVAMVVGMLLLRRPLVIWLLSPFIPQLERRRDIWFVAWFAPIAVAAVYYAALAGPLLGEPLIWEAVSLAIVGSIVAHGITAVPLTRLYERLQGQQPETPAESQPAEEDQD